MELLSVPEQSIADGDVTVASFSISSVAIKTT